MPNKKASFAAWITAPQSSVGEWNLCKDLSQNEWWQLEVNGIVRYLIVPDEQLGIYFAHAMKGTKQHSFASGTFEDMVKLIEVTAKLEQ